MLLPDVSNESFVVSKIVSKLATCCDAKLGTHTSRIVSNTPIFLSFLFYRRKRKCGIRVDVDKKDIRSLFVQVPIKQIKEVAKAGK